MQKYVYGALIRTKRFFPIGAPTLSTKVVLSQYTDERQKFVHLSQIQNGAVVQFDHTRTLTIERSGFLRSANQ